MYNIFRRFFGVLFCFYWEHKGQRMFGFKVWDFFFLEFYFLILCYSQNLGQYTIFFFFFGMIISEAVYQFSGEILKEKKYVPSTNELKKSTLRCKNIRFSQKKQVKLMNNHLTLVDTPLFVEGTIKPTYGFRR